MAIILKKAWDEYEKERSGAAEEPHPCTAWNNYVGKIFSYFGRGSSVYLVDGEIKPNHRVAIPIMELL